MSRCASTPPSTGCASALCTPTPFWAKQFRLGSICSPLDEVRRNTIDHFVDCVRITREMGSNVIGIWLADGTNYPGQDHLRSRKHRMWDGLKALYDAMDADMTLLVEYKFFEPASTRPT